MFVVQLHGASTLSSSSSPANGAGGGATTHPAAAARPAKPATISTAAAVSTKGAGAAAEEPNSPSPSEAHAQAVTAMLQEDDGEGDAPAAAANDDARTHVPHPTAKSTAATVIHSPAAALPTARSARMRAASPRTITDDEAPSAARVAKKARAPASSAASARAPAAATPSSAAAPIVRLPSTGGPMQMETQSVDPFTFGLQHPSPVQTANKLAPASASASGSAAGRTTSPRPPRPEHAPAAAAQSSVAKAAPSSTSAAAAAASSSSRSKHSPAPSPPAARKDPDDILDLSGDDDAAMADQPAPSPRAPSAPPAEIEAEQERPYGDDAGMDDLQVDLQVDHTTVDDADQPAQLPPNMFSERISPAFFSPKVGGGLHSPAPTAFAPVQPPSPPPAAAAAAAASASAAAPPTKMHAPIPTLPPAKSSALALVASAFPAQANALTAAAAAAATPLSLLSPALPASQIPIPAEVRAAAESDAQAGITHAAKSEWAAANSRLTSAIDSLYAASHSYSSVPPMWLKQRSTVLVKLGQNSEAFADAHRMVTYHPHDFAGFYVLSTWLGRDKNYSSALMECRKAWRRVGKRKTTTAIAAAAKRAAEGNPSALAAAIRAEKDAELDRQKVGDRVHQLESKLHLPPSKLDFDHQLSSEEINALEAKEEREKEGAKADGAVAIALSPPAQHGGAELHTPQHHQHRPASAAATPRASDRVAPATPASAATSAAVGGRSAPNSPAVLGAKKTLDFGADGTAATTQLIPPSPAKPHASAAAASSSPSFGPPIALGTYKLAGSMCTAALSDAFRCGFRRIDSGMSYGNEELIGRALAMSGLPRSSVSLCSKLSWDQLTSLDNAYTQALLSLKRFDTTYLDLFLLHHPARAKLPRDSVLHASSRRECWKGLEKLLVVAEGKVRQIGVSNFEIKHLSGLMGGGAAGGPGGGCASSSVKIRPSVNQIELHPLMYATQLELVQWCQSRGITIQAYSPLGSGKKELLSHPLVCSIARACKRSPAEVLIRWSVQHGFVPIVKTVNASHMKLNLAAAADPPSFVLSAEQMSTLDQGKDAKRFAWDPRPYV